MIGPNASEFRNYSIKPAEGLMVTRCPVRSCGKPIRFLCCFEYRRPQQEWRTVEKTRCHDHAAAFAKKHGVTFPKGEKANVGDENYRGIHATYHFTGKTVAEIEKKAIAKLKEDDFLLPKEKRHKPYIKSIEFICTLDG